MDKKQFETVNDLHEFLANSKKTIAKVEREIEVMKKEASIKITNTYDLSNSKPLYLVQFDFSHRISFFRATKSRIIEVELSWFNNDYYENEKIAGYEQHPKCVEDCEEIFKWVFSNMPTACAIREQNRFGFFHDINREYTIKEWLMEEILTGEIPYTTDEENFMRAVDVIKDFFIKRKD